MRVADVQLAFPVIMLAIAIVAVVGTSPAALVGVLALSGWVLYARTVRANVLTIRRLEYVEAARTLGASDLRDRRSGTSSPTRWPRSSSSARASSPRWCCWSRACRSSAWASSRRSPSWGRMLAEGRDYLSNAWWLATVPGMAISLVVLGANLLGDGLRDLLDPRLG